MSDVTPPPIIDNQERDGRLSPQVLRDDHGRILQDISCRNCGYNLRGLPDHAQCPECDIPIARSIQGDLLQLCEPRWVQRLAAGALWIIFGVLGGIVLSLIAGVVGTVLIIAGVISQQTFIVALVGITLLIASAQVIGFWMLTEPDPGAQDDKPLTARILARYCLLVTLVAAPLQILADPSGGGVGSVQLMTLGGLQLALGIAAIVLLAAQTVGYFALFTYARQLALRIPEMSLASHARIVKWGYLAMQILGIATAIAMLIAMPFLFGAMAGAGAPPPPPVPATAPASAPGASTSSTSPNSAAPASTSTATLTLTAPPPTGLLVLGASLGCITAVVGLVFQIWAIVLLFRFRSQFRLAATQAKENWARSDLTTTLAIANPA